MYFNNGDVFSKRVETLLTLVGAKEYIDLFKNANIGIDTLYEMDETDLSMIGIEDIQIQDRIIKHFKQIGQSSVQKNNNLVLSVADAMDILEKNKKYLYNLCLRFQKSQINLQKYSPEDILLDCNPNQYASDIIIKALDCLENIIIDSQQEIKELQTKLDSKKTERTKKEERKRKTYVLTLLGGTILILSFALVKSLKAI